jgi:selenocysteine-specific elongation factor
VRTVVTAGHVDHGKTTLVRALTGMDPDRLAEEKARGLTIDLGYAWTVLGVGDDAIETAIVDVPGHARFVKNMLAGVGGVSGCLFVVSAAEGWMPQSEEHLRILELAGLRGGVVALTRAAAVSPQQLAGARSTVAGAVAGSFLAAAPVIETDSPTALGLDDVRRALHALLASEPAPRDVGRPRLWVDRAFRVRGAGTVVTGTLAGGSITVGDSLLLAGPGGPPATVRARQLEALRRPRDRVQPGERVACNLAGAAKRFPVRGDALIAAGTFQMSACFDGMCEVLPKLGHPLTKRGAFTIHIGSGEHPARLTLLGNRKEIAPGGAGAVRIRLAAPLPLCLGDRFVVRESGRGETLGGGAILDVAPVRPVSKATPAGTVDGILTERGFMDAGELWCQTGERRVANVGRYVASPHALADRAASLSRRITAAGSTGLEIAELDEINRALVHRLDGAMISYGRATSPMAVAADETVDSWVTSLRQAPFQPPPPIDTARGQLRELVQSGVVVETRGIHFADTAVEEATRRLEAVLGTSPDGITLAELRTVLGTSRRYALALLEHFDTVGITRRRGDVRVAGPQLAKRAASE